MFHQGAYEAEEQLGLPQQRGPFSLPGHLMNGTGGVEVNHVVRVIGKRVKGLKENVRLTAEQLDAEGPIQGRGAEEPGSSRSRNPGPAIYHLRKGEGAAELPRNEAKRKVAHPGHRGKHKRHVEVKEPSVNTPSFYRERPAASSDSGRLVYNYSYAET